ncbi:MAG: PAS domain S-box protein [Thermomonas sp.]|uniref:MHYT domain-containing protein n=1 Tax=Thermomonas sp. TaxID=1971895 RepID=UPI001ED70870|nr:MHYT domain-containing protein [Thermomonas sp.]MBV2210323.1 PAS domain S-box protein [Thermomonas sp.]
MFERFFTQQLAADPMLWQQHNPWLVALSLLVSMGAAAVALYMASLARRATLPGNRQLALTSGALALGSGIWTMHYVGMLAFALCGRAGFSPWLTLLSVVPGLAASWAALRLLIREQIRFKHLLAGGVLVGAGIGAMHYIGMAASAVAPLMRYDAFGFALSIVVAVLLAMLALWIRFGLEKYLHLRSTVTNILAGSVMGLAIAGMHYTGMAALRFTTPITQIHITTPTLPLETPIALAIIGVTVALSLILVATNSSLRYRNLLERSRQNEARLRALNNTAVDAIITFNEYGIIQSANPATAHILGWNEAELLGQDILTLVSDSFKQQHRGELRKYTLGQPSRLDDTHDIDMRHKEGHTVPMRLALGRIESDDAQTPPRFVSFLVDMTHYKALEEERQRDREQLRSLMSNLPGAAFRCRNEDPWPMEYISDGVKGFTGWDAHDFVQGHVHFGQLVNPDDAQRIAGEMEVALSQNTPYSIEYRIQARDRSTHWISENGRGVLDDQGRIRWIDGVLLDISAIKKRDAEFIGTVQALNRSEAIAEFDLQGRLINANKNFLALTGYSLEEIQFQPHFIFCTHAEAQSTAYHEFWSHLLQGQYQAGEFLRLGKNGQKLWIQASYNPILDPEGNVFKIIKFATDLSQRKAIEEDLREAKDRAEQAATARSNFLANMSHEIRTPMNAILGFTDSLLDSPINSSQRRQLSTVQSASRSLLRLLNDILDTAKLDKGAMTLEALDFSLRNLCQLTLDTLRITAAGKGLALQLDYPSEEPDYLRGDALRVQQVLTNIIGNAVKFTAEGSVTLRVRYRDQRLFLGVQDTGIGMSPEQVARVFSPFAQADASTSRRFGGSGLGTTIALQLVELMGGTITVKSQLGEGSTFFLELPIPLGEAVAPLAPAAHFTLPPLRILAADDVAANLEVLQLALVRGGHQLTAVNSGTEAIAQLEKQHFDLVLMDLQMPGLDGFATARRIREIEQSNNLAATPIIALSASVLDDDRSLAIAAGMDGFAHKPLDLPKLQSEIARVLGIHLPSVGSTSAAQAAIFDWDRGLQLWGSMPALRTALAQFLRDNAALSHSLTTLQPDTSALAAAAHRLRGAAGNLGLTALYDALTVLETQARSSSAGDLTAALQAVCRAWEAVLQVTPTSLQDAPNAAVPAFELSDEACQRALQAIHALRSTLQRGELSDRLITELETLLSSPQLQRVQKALDTFDFENAQAGLNLLEQQLRSKTT